MNTQPFVSLISLGDDKKFPLNRSNNIKCKQIVALQLPLLGTKYQNASIIISNQAVKGKRKVGERLCPGNLISKMHNAKLN